MCAQQRFKSVRASTQYDQSHPHEETLHTCLSKMGSVKILIRLQMRRLIWIFAGCLCPEVCFLTLLLKCSTTKYSMVVDLFVVLCLTLCFFFFFFFFVLVFFSPFSIAITSLGEERASAFRTFVRFVLVWICRFPLPLGVWEGLRFVIVALPGLFSYLFYDCSPL